MHRDVKGGTEQGWTDSPVQPRETSEDLLNAWSPVNYDFAFKIFVLLRFGTESLLKKTHRENSRKTQQDLFILTDKKQPL